MHERRVQTRSFTMQRASSLFRIHLRLRASAAALCCGEVQEEGGGGGSGGGGGGGSMRAREASGEAQTSENGVF